MIFPCLLLILLGLVLFIIGIIKVMDRIKHLTNSKILEGKVIEVDSHYNDGDMFYAPIIEYVDPYDNSICTYESKYSYNKEYKVNDIVKFRYYRDGNKKLYT